MKSNLIVSYFLSIVISFLFIFSCGNVAEEALQNITDEALKNLCPIATPDTYTVVSGGTLTVTFSNGILSNDADPGGGAMSASIIITPKNPIITASVRCTLIFSLRISTFGGFCFLKLFYLVPHYSFVYILKL